MEKTCLSRILGECKNCSVNYDPSNRPNNYDCKKYYEVHIQIYEVIEEDLIKKEESNLAKVAV